MARGRVYGQAMTAPEEQWGVEAGRAEQLGDPGDGNASWSDRPRTTTRKASHGVTRGDAPVRGSGADCWDRDAREAASDLDGEVGDQSLLFAHVAGDRQAFGVLMRRHSERLWRVAFRILQDPDDADDAVQDATYRAYRSAADFRGEAGVVTWLHTVVTNAALDIAMDPRRTVPVTTIPTADHEPPAATDAAELRIYLEDALRRLEPKLRGAFFLVALRGFSIHEAGALLATESGVVPAGTVKVWVHRARARLAEQLATRDE